ncbi:MAG TPA: hypothetical protein VIC55_01520 [Gemmatimonadaceae bacterium]
MVRTAGLAAALGFTIIAARPSPQPSPACLLLTAPEASKLMGFPVVVDSGDKARMNFHCRYNKSQTSFYGVEITYRVLPDAQAAHAYFPRWVIPVPPKPADMTLIPVQGIGDEATLLHGKILNGVYFRHGSVLVKAGT